jgi:glycosyltransferase involved in cell wall biosynthesis
MTNINLMTPVGYTGYGYVGLNILKTLYAQNNRDNIGLHLIGQPNVENDTEASIIQKYLSNGNNLPYDTTCLKIWHQFDLLNRIGRGKYVVFPFFELDKIADKEVFHLNFPDHIIVSSTWAKNVLLNNGVVRPIDVVPLGVDTQTFDYKTFNQKTNDTYVFCTIGKWEKRKAHDTIIDCFTKAFEISDNVELWLVTHNSFLTPQEEQNWISLVSQSKLSNKIKIFPRLPSHEDIAKLISYTSCGVYISRGEGWNMELLETMAMNKPVIVSNYSAHTEYCNNDNSYLVEINEVEPAIDNKWFFGQGKWAALTTKQTEQTIEYMRYMYKNNIRDNPSGLKTAQQLSWSNTIGHISDLLD